MIQDTSAQDVTIKETPAWRKHWQWIAAAVGLVAMSGFAYPQYKQWQQNELSIDGTTLRIAEVTRGDFTRDLSASGKIVAAHAPTVYSSAQGNVELMVLPGDSVKAGQVVAKVSSPTLTNQLKQQQSVLESLTLGLARQKLNVRSETLKQQQVLDMAEVALTAAQREHRRAKTSIEKAVISQIDFEQAADELARAELAYNHAKQEVELNKDTLAFELKTAGLDVSRQQLVVDDLNRQVEALTIRAPLEGVVGNLLVEQRAQVEPNQGLMTVVDLTAYETELLVPENYADDIGLGMDTEIMVNGNKVMGRISAISPEVENAQVTTRVRFNEQDNLSLRQNQRVTARILLEHKTDVLMVKRGQFVQSGGGKIAYRIAGDSAKRIPVQVGARSISQVELLEGVKAGDRLVISSLEPFQQAKQVLIR